MNTQKFSNTPLANNSIIVHYFNSDTCGYCIRFKPEWKKFVNSLTPSDNIKVVNESCGNNNSNCDKFNVTGYPTIVFERPNNFITYDGPRTVGGLRKALNLDQKQTAIYNFSLTGSDISYQTMWNTFVNSVLDQDDVSTYDIKCDISANQDMCNQFNITNYPTIIIKQGDIVTNYDGPLNARDLKHFIGL